MSVTPGAPAPSATPPASASGALNAPTPPPASATPPAATGTPPPAPSAASTPPAATGGDWTTGLNDDAKGYVQNKGFKNPGDVLESYRNLEKLHGVPQDRILKLPENMDSPEGRAVRERLGLPKTAAEYGLDKIIPKEAAKFAEWAAQTFHEIGLPLKDAEKIITKWNERSQAAQAQTKENYEASITTGEQALKKDWGAAYDQKINLAKQGVRALELSGPELDQLERVIGRERLFKKLSAIGAGVGEAPFVQGRPAAEGIVAPEQARQKIQELKNDQLWVKRFLGGDIEAKGQMERYQKMAYPDMITV